MALLIKISMIICGASCIFYLITNLVHKIVTKRRKKAKDNGTSNNPTFY